MTSPSIPQSITGYCSTTDQPFTPLAVRLQPVGTHLFVWMYCPYCDASLRTRDDPNFDALRPQSHCQEVKHDANTHH